MVWLAVAGGLPHSYQGKPFQDDVHRSGPQTIPGVLQCALYDLGGEGVAYHDTGALINRNADSFSLMNWRSSSVGVSRGNQ
jgi:hypothetical protein